MMTCTKDATRPASSTPQLLVYSTELVSMSLVAYKFECDSSDEHQIYRVRDVLCQDISVIAADVFIVYTGSCDGTPVYVL